MAIEPRKRLGLFQSWLVSRMGQAFFLFVAGSLVLHWRDAPWQLTALSGAAFLLVMYWFFPTAYGYADQSGITFRRYFKQHHVPWDDVSKAEWGGKFGVNFLKLTFESPIGFSRHVDFAVISNIWELWKVYSREWTPEIVPWVMNRVRPH